MATPRPRRSSLIGAGFAILLFVLASGETPAGAQQPKTVKTVLDGVYTAAQASRGKAAFEMSCAGCHRADLSGFSGPPLKGNLFMDRWREFRLNVLYDLIRLTMPKDAAAPLNESIYLDIFAYLLQSNEIPAGPTELRTTILESTLLVGKDGPQPLPSSSQVTAVGCLTLDSGNGWFLTKAAEPVRTLDAYDFTAPEIAEARGTFLGDQLFRLQSLPDLPGFTTEPTVNNKIVVKGILVRQPRNERINVTAFKVVGTGCADP